ncbi:hypothetical protein CCR94_09360 [Rhodoblastus sphagnicola]|uniref:Proteinase inhibitor I42 chagasin domain-containing protein n=1 Tax=Rhodoblastus sphagnicola TaxID=333368 RepID=A0A2S6NA46_9HYPH|nr:protease inhibitor I42 family protein [Rhodoblastus sphagnicola]MBB4198875.1 putative secreted protein [Rhodoblastus sphagnicola]PPQ31492.1 hypothetical protein CCR94_09360 [Rhodoblastus sphagnicola]
MISLNFSKTLAALALASPLLVGGPARAEPLRLTEADAGKSFALRVGDEVEVRLGETASTGFVWSEQADGAPGLKKLGRDSDYPKPLPGAPGAAIFRYRAEVSGATVLSLRCARGWEKNQPPVQEFSARFDIRP